MCRKYSWLAALIAAVLFAACPLEGDVSFGEETEGTEYTITFSANGGTGSAPVSQTAESGSRVVLPNAEGLSKAGSVFGGWCESAAGTGTKFAVGSSYTMPNNNVTLYAYWGGSTNTNTCTVTFNANGGTGTPPAAQTVTAGTVITIPDRGSMYRGADTFHGWSTSPSGALQYSHGSSYTVTANVTLYAFWQIGETRLRRIYFRSNGGQLYDPSIGGLKTARDWTVQGAQGSNMTLPGPVEIWGYELLKSGYTFGGWNTNPEGTGVTYPVGASFFVTETLTEFYAKWNRGGGGGGSGGSGGGPSGAPSVPIGGGGGGGGGGATVPPSSVVGAR